MQKPDKKTPYQKEKELRQLGLSEKEVQILLKEYKTEYVTYLKEERKDVFQTNQAVDYINQMFDKEKLIELTKDKMTVPKLRSLTIKPNKERQLEGRIRPIDPYANNRMGFYYSKESLDEFIREEIELRKIPKEVLFKQNQRLKEENKHLKQSIESDERIIGLKDETIDLLKKQVEELEKQVEQKEQQENTEEHIKKEIETLRAENKSLKKEIESLKTSQAEEKTAEEIEASNVHDKDINKTELLQLKNIVLDGDVLSFRIKGKKHRATFEQGGLIKLEENVVGRKYKEISVEENQDLVHLLMEERINKLADEDEIN